MGINIQLICSADHVSKYFVEDIIVQIHNLQDLSCEANVFKYVALTIVAMYESKTFIIKHKFHSVKNALTTIIFLLVTMISFMT